MMCIFIWGSDCFLHILINFDDTLLLDPLVFVSGQCRAFHVFYILKLCQSLRHGFGLTVYFAKKKIYKLIVT